MCKAATKFLTLVGMLIVRPTGYFAFRVVSISNRQGVIHETTLLRVDAREYRVYQVQSFGCAIFTCGLFNTVSVLPKPMKRPDDDTYNGVGKTNIFRRRMVQCLPHRTWEPRQIQLDCAYSASSSSPRRILFCNQLFNSQVVCPFREVA